MSHGEPALRNLSPGQRHYWRLILVGMILGVMLTGCSVGYLWHVTVGQAKLLARQQAVDEVLHNSQLSEQERQKIQLILDVRTFAVESLGFDLSDSYTTFVRVDGPYVSYIVSAALKDALQSYVWHFPIVGRVPYKGFFQKTYALREEQKLAAAGYDTYVRGVRAFSTLGYFNDPILSCMLTYTDSTLINTIIHELLHQTIWIKGHVSFNESLANFVGEHGTLAYLAQRYGAASPEVQAYRDMRADAGVFEAYMHALIERLQTLYQQPISRAEKLHRREQLFAEAKVAYPSVFPDMKTPYYQRYFEQRTLNNAMLISFQQYHHDTAFFEQALIEHGGDLRRMIATFKTLRPHQIPASFRRR
jgi:predicted aminopeptidase